MLMRPPRLLWMRSEYPEKGRFAELQQVVKRSFCNSPRISEISQDAFCAPCLTPRNGAQAFVSLAACHVACCCPLSSLACFRYFPARRVFQTDGDETAISTHLQSATFVSFRASARFRCSKARRSTSAASRPRTTAG